MTVDFELDGQEFTALNGGPIFKLNEANRSSFIAKPRRKWTSSGTSFSKAEPKASAAG